MTAHKTRKKTWIALALIAVLNAGILVSIAADKAHIRAVAFKIIRPDSSDTEILKAVTDYVRDEIYHPTLQDVQSFPWYVRWNYLYSRTRPGPATVLRYGTHHFAPCQSNSRALKALLAAHGIPTQVIVMHDNDLSGIHSVLEVKYAGAPGIVEPTYGVIYQHPDGRPATLDELRNNYALYLANAVTGFAYGWGPDRKSHIRAMPAEYNFNHAYYFNYKWLGPLRWPVFRMMQSWAGPEGLDVLTRPGWYSYPGYTCLVLLDGGLLLSVLTVRFFRRLKKRFGKIKTPLPSP